MVTKQGKGNLPRVIESALPGIQVAWVRVYTHMYTLFCVPSDLSANSFFGRIKLQFDGMDAKSKTSVYCVMNSVSGVISE